MHLETPGGAEEVTERISTNPIGRAWNIVSFGIDSEDQKVYDVSPEIYGETAASVLAEVRETINTTPPVLPNRVASNTPLESVADRLKLELDNYVGGDSSTMSDAEIEAIVAEDPNRFLDLFTDNKDDRLQENHANKYVLNPRIEAIKKELVEKEVKYGETRAWYMKTLDYLQEPYNIAKMALEVTVTRGSLTAATIARAGIKRAVAYQITKDIVAASAIETADAMRLVESGVITQEEANVRILLATGLTGVISTPLNAYQGKRAINILAKQRGAEQVTDEFITENLKKIKEANENLGKQIEAEANAISDTERVLDPQGRFTKELSAVRDMLYRIKNKLCKLF